MLNGIYGDNSEEAKEFKNVCSREYDSHLGYRLMESLRNYVQHRDLPIRGITHGHRWDDDRTQARNVVAIMLDVPNIKSDKDFKKSFREEFEALGEKVDLKPFAREYVECLGRIHTYTREVLGASLDEWKRTILDARNRYRDTTGDDEEGASLIAYNDVNEIVERIPLMKEHIERHSWFLRKNAHITHYSKHFVSGEISK